MRNVSTYGFSVVIFHCNYVNNSQYIGSEYIHFGNPPNPSKLSGWYNTSDDGTLIKYNPISLIDDNVDDEETPLFKKYGRLLTF